MASARDDTAVEGTRGWDVARDFIDLVGRAFALAIALGLLLTGAAVVLPAPLDEPVPKESCRPEAPLRYVVWAQLDRSPAGSAL